MTESLKIAYLLYFGFPVVIQEKTGLTMCFVRAVESLYCDGHKEKPYTCHLVHKCCAGNQLITKMTVTFVLLRLRVLIGKLSRVLHMHMSLKEGVFGVPQVRKIISDFNVDTLLSTTERVAWNSFKTVVRDFFSINKSENNKEIVSDSLQNYHKMGVNMSIDSFSTFPLGFFSGKLRKHERRTRRAFSPGSKGF